MAELHLFDPPAGPDPAPAARMSADARRTQRNRDLLAAGTHPATRRKLLVIAEGAERPTCATCVHAVDVHRGNTRAWKCERHRLGLSHSAASDIRVSWPACALYERRSDSASSSAS